MAVIAALVIVVVGLSRHLPAPAGATSQAQPATPALAADAAPAAAPAVVKPRVVNESPNKTAGQAPTKRRAESGKSAAAAAKPASIVDAPEKQDSADNSTAPESTPTAPEPASVSTASAAPAPVTITGCLEISADEKEFRLTDTEGADAPKARSWRTGFFKKRSAPVALVELSDRAALKGDVGKRVAATGLLNSHALKVSSLRVVRSSCN